MKNVTYQVYHMIRHRAWNNVGDTTARGVWGMVWGHVSNDVYNLICKKVRDRVGDNIWGDHKGLIEWKT